MIRSDYSPQRANASGVAGGCANLTVLPGSRWFAMLDRGDARMLARA